MHLEDDVDHAEPEEARSRFAQSEITFVRPVTQTRSRGKFKSRRSVLSTLNEDEPVGREENDLPVRRPGRLFSCGRIRTPELRPLQTLSATQEEYSGCCEHKCKQRDAPGTQRRNSTFCPRHTGL